MKLKKIIIIWRMSKLHKIDTRNLNFCIIQKYESSLQTYCPRRIWSLRSHCPLMGTTSLEKWILRRTTILDIFSYKCNLVKCNCPLFCGDKKRIFVNSNASILQSTEYKFLKFFPHLKQAYYKILQLHMSKNVFFLKFGTCTRNGSFGAFLVKT